MPDIRGMQANDILRLKTVEDVQLSPDGRRVAYVLREIDARTDQYRSTIWVVATHGNSPPLQYTRGSNADTTPRWAPDGRQLAFLSDRGGGRPQLYVMPADGGEGRPLTALPAGAGEPIWSPDGTRVLFTAPVLSEAPPKERDAIERWRQRPKVVDAALFKFDGTGFLLQGRLQLFLVSTAGGAPQQITSGNVTHWQPSWSPDGRSIAFCQSRTGKSDSHCFDIWTSAADGSGARQITESVPTAVWPTWSPDGQRIAFYGSLEVADLMPWVWSIAASGGVPRPHTAHVDREVPMLPGFLVGGPAWSADGTSLIFPIADAGTVHLARCRVDRDAVETIVSGERCVLLPSVRNSARQIAFSATTVAEPGDVYACALDGTEERRLTSVNAEVLRDIVLPTLERRRFRSPHGGEIDGFVIRPLDGSGSAPLLLDIHGGPQGFVGPAFPRQTYWLTLAARGWAVLALNPHGSGSYGRDFNYSLRRGWGEYDFPEHMAAVDALISEGLADPQRLAVVGYSYGGYMTAWMVTHTDRFKAAVIGAPLVNLESASGTQDLGTFLNEWHFGPLFAERETYRRLSPSNYVERVTTPTLLLHGEADDRCPIGQSEEFFAGLMLAGKAPVQFVRYPGASHGFIGRGRPSHRVDFNTRIVDWLERWLARE